MEMERKKDIFDPKMSSTIDSIFSLGINEGLVPYYI